MIHRLCLALGNDILMRWLEARLQGRRKLFAGGNRGGDGACGEGFEELRTLVNEDPPPSVRDMQHAVNMADFGIWGAFKRYCPGIPCTGAEGHCRYALDGSSGRNDKKGRP